MSILDGLKGSKTSAVAKKWIKIFIYILVIFLILLVVLNIVRWLLEEKYKSDKKTDVIDISGYTGEMFNPFSIIGDIQALISA